MTGRGYMDHRKKRTLKKQGILLAILVALLIPGAVVLHAIDTHQTVQTKDSLDEDVVEINGVACTLRNNIKTYLFMGIDDTAEKGENYITGGQCDTLQLLVVDQTRNTYSRLPINRNTLTEVRSYDEEGEDLGTSVCQIAYAHAHGDGGGTLSCENTVEAVSNYLGGIDIDGYAALNMEGVGLLNHLAGGVTVTIEDDFSQYDPTLVQGETIRLSDEQALHFVRGRMTVGDGKNESRMRRQEQFLEALRGAMTEKVKADSGFAAEVYDTLTDVMVTDLTGKEFSRLANAMVTCQSQGIVEIQGAIGEDNQGFSTFEPDQESVDDARLALFYEPVDA